MHSMIIIQSLIVFVTIINMIQLYTIGNYIGIGGWIVVLIQCGCVISLVYEMED